MSRKKLIFLAACFLCLAALSLSLAKINAAPDAPSASYSIPWWTVDGGGGRSQGGAYTLSGTAGQPDAVTSSGGAYTLRGGFWSGRFDYSTYLPLIRR